MSGDGDEKAREYVTQLAGRLEEFASLLKFHGEHFVAIGLGDKDRVLWAGGASTPLAFYLYADDDAGKLANMQHVVDIFDGLFDEPDGARVNPLGENLYLTGEIGGTRVEFVATGIAHLRDDLNIEREAV